MGEIPSRIRGPDTNSMDAFHGRMIIEWSCRGGCPRRDVWVQRTVRSRRQIGTECIARSDFGPRKQTFQILHLVCSIDFRVIIICSSPDALNMT